MRHASLLVLPAAAVLLSSCGLVGGVLKPVKGLVQAGARTVTDAGDASGPATREQSELHGIALRIPPSRASRSAPEPPAP